MLEILLNNYRNFQILLKMIKSKKFTQEIFKKSWIFFQKIFKMLVKNSQHNQFFEKIFGIFKKKFRGIPNIFSKDSQ